MFSDPGGIQTHDFQNRNLTFYSAELRGRKEFAKIRKKHHPTKEIFMDIVSLIEYCCEKTIISQNTTTVGFVGQKT